MTASTKSDSPKIKSAGVETGEKMLVELEDSATGCAKRPAASASPASMIITKPTADAFMARAKRK